MTRILIADDHDVVRSGVRAILEGHEGWEVVGEARGVQGNLDGALLFGPWERVERSTLDVLARAGGRPGHIFNLGHGVMPGTDPDVLGRLRELVHEQTARVAA